MHRLSGPSRRVNFELFRNGGSDTHTHPYAYDCPDDDKQHLPHSYPYTSKDPSRFDPDKIPEVNAISQFLPFVRRYCHLLTLMLAMRHILYVNLTGVTNVSTGVGNSMQGKLDVIDYNGTKCESLRKNASSITEDFVRRSYSPTNSNTSDVSESSRNDPQPEENASPYQETRYLLYYPHSGFANQLIALRKAAMLALATKRTLVLPPVLSHLTASKKEKKLFPSYEGRGAGGGCKPYNKYFIFIKALQDDVQLAASQKVSRFPSYTSIFNFEALSNRTGLDIIDMPDFAGESSNNTNYGMWCIGNNELRKKMSQHCGDKVSFAEMASALNETCGMDERVAAIGSAFIIPEPYGRYALNPMNDFFLTMPLSPKLKTLVKELHDKLPKGYVGAHIRFNDGQVIRNCNAFAVKKTYKHLFEQLNALNVATGGSKKHVLMGNGNNAAKKCFEHHDTKKEYNVFTINQLIDRDISLEKLVGSISLEEGTVFLLLDLIFLGLADVNVFARFDTGSSNTFQDKIRQIHRRKEAIMTDLFL